MQAQSLIAEESSLKKDKKKIKELSSAGLSQRKIASLYKVDKRLISFILNPSALEENLKRRAERGKVRTK